MKNVFILCCIGILALVILGCENSLTMANVSETAYAKGAGHDDGFKLEPSGDLSGAIDTVAIQNALDSCPPGGTVKLGDGYFYINRPIFVIGFKGTLKGEGKDETVIETAIGFEPVLNPLADYQFETAEVLSFYWSKDYVTVKDLTIQTLSESPSRSYNNQWLGETTVMNNLLNIIDASYDSERLSVTCKNVKMQGATSTDPTALNGMNVGFPLVVGGWGRGIPIDIMVKDCEVYGSGGVGIVHASGAGGTATFKDNTIVDSWGWAGIELWIGNQGCDILVKGNEFHGDFGGPAIAVTEESVARVMCNDYDNLSSCPNGCAVQLYSEGNEVYEALAERPDLNVCGDPNANIIVTDARCSKGGGKNKGNDHRGKKKDDD